MQVWEKYEKLSSRELIRLNKLLGEQAKERDDDFLFEMWQEVARALEFRNVN